MINQDQRSQNNNTALDENNFSFDARVDKVDISIPLQQQINSSNSQTMVTQMKPMVE